MGEFEEKLKFTTEGADDAAKAYRDVAKGAGAATKAQDTTSKSAAGLAKAAAIATVAYTAMKAVFVDSVAVFADVDAEQGRIVRNLKQMGLDAQSIDTAMKEVNKTFRENVKFGLKVSEQTVAFRELLDVTKDRQKAEEDLALAVNIQAEGIVNLQGATAALKKVREGDVGALKKLNVLSKEQIKDLSKIKDEATRTQVALDILNQEFAGAAEMNAGLGDQLAANEANYERLQIAIGKVVSEMGGATTGFIGRTLEAVAGMEEGSITVDNFATAMEGLASATSEASSELSTLISELSGKDVLDIVLAGGLLSEGGQVKVAEILSRTEDRLAQQALDTQKEKEKEDAEGPTGPKLTPEARIRIAQAAASDGKKPTGKKAEGPLAGAGAATSLDTDEALKAIEEQLGAEATLREEARDRLILADQERTTAEQEEATKRAEIRAMEMEEEAKAAEAAETLRKTRLTEDRKAAAGQRAIAGDIVSTGADVAAGAIKNEQAQLAFQAISAGARAAVTLALAITPPPVGGPQYLAGGLAQAAAAVSMAAKAGKSGASVAPKGAAGGAGAPAPPTDPGIGSQSLTDQDRLALVGEREEAQRGGGGFTLNVFTNFPPSPEQARDLFDSVEGERANRPQL